MHTYIIEAIRTPRGKGKPDGALHSIEPAKLLGQLYQQLNQRLSFDTGQIDEVFTGCVTQIGDQGGNIGHVAMRLAGWEARAAGVTLSSFCSSSLTTLSLARSRILAGEGDLYISAGVESMSRVPLMSDKPYGFRDYEAGQKIPVIPNPLIADIIATRNGYTRDSLDQYAVQSHLKASLATERGYFARSLVPVVDHSGMTLLDRDEIIRPNTTLEKLSQFIPLFAEQGIGGFEEVVRRYFPELSSVQHFHHAGNAPGMVDGASVVMLASGKALKQMNVEPRARLVDMSARSAPPHLGLCGGLKSAEHLLAKHNLRSTDVDLWDFNEGFAGIACDFRDQLGIPDERFNVNGSGIAMGHAMGATGGNLTSMMCDELERRHLKRGIIAISGAMGAGGAALIERL